MLKLFKNKKPKPIYEIIMVENADKELCGCDGTPLGSPGFDSMQSVGFYYNLGDAVTAVEMNSCDIRETIYDAAFILIRCEGLYPLCGKEKRMFFRWDKDKQKYYQAEEPILFKLFVFNVLIFCISLTFSVSNHS